MPHDLLLYVSASLRESFIREVAIVLFSCLFAAASFADDAEVETILTGLSNPCGIAIRPSGSPDQYEIFIADSGAGRVVRITSDQPQVSTDVITGFEMTTLGKLGLPVGPIALLFIDRDLLLVGASGDDGGASLRLYDLSDQTLPLAASQATQRLVLANENDAALPSRNHVYALARTIANDRVPDAVLATLFSQDQSGDVRKTAIRAGTVGKVRSFVAAETSSPTAVAVDKRGFVVVAWVGSLDVPRGSRLVYYNPIDDAPVMSLSSNLYDILGLAYHPKSGNLYAVDGAWRAAEQGGVFRIDDASQPAAPQCKAVKIADVLRPSSLAFGPDGALYLTAFGDLDSDQPAPGVVLRITDGL